VIVILFLFPKKHIYLWINYKSQHSDN
jgi:hypothetical protein